MMRAATLIGPVCWWVCGIEHGQRQGGAPSMLG
jgi:hypothetical protein